ncbi:hypothetical protein MED01_002488 [Micromonospora sp. MED01]|uniref:hypothetical protein n=1 Tax=Micromonospora alfalfae TaxID=2911212 RepID=UPI001EE96292|nr:hypothetical protein [Micromonospora alfalfae]MCG5464322.1 hypothetical protein [Micromonospora alfalfae]
MTKPGWNGRTPTSALAKPDWDTPDRPAPAQMRIRAVSDMQPHEIHRDEFEDAHMAAAGAIMGARMAGRNIPPWTADMNEAFRAAVAEAFDAGAQAERKAAR